MGFIRYWIDRYMESPEAREEKTRLHLEKVSADAEALTTRWAQPPKPAGYWNARSATSITANRLSQAEADVISPYERMLADMDASKKAKEQH